MNLNSNQIRECSECRLNCRYLGELSEKELSEYNLNKRVILFNKGETIYKQQTFVSNIIFIREGLVKLILEGTSGKNLIVKVFKKHDYIGFPFLLGENYSHYTAIALKETEVCMIEKDFLKNLMETNHTVSNTVAKNYANEFDYLFDKLNELGTKNLHGRLAKTILYLSGQEFENENIYNYLTRKDIAELSGMSVESMVRLFNEFKNDKLIEIKNKQIIINDRLMMEKLVQSG